MKNMNAAKSGSTKPYAAQVRFLSRGGQKFMAMAKNKAWDKDFYNDLVGPALNEDIDVETWERVKAIPPEEKPGEAHKVVAMQGVNLSPLKIPYAWSEYDDHAKLAISDADNPPGSRWVCVGDINFTDAQEKRGGGTVAFQCDPLWNSLNTVLSAKAAAATATAATAATAAQAPAAPQRAIQVVTAPERTAKPPQKKTVSSTPKTAAAVKQLATRPKAKAAKSAARRSSS
jgi:hypothetical protein